MKLTKLASLMLAKVLPLVLEGCGYVEVDQACVIDVGKGPAPLAHGSSLLSFMAFVWLPGGRL